MPSETVPIKRSVTYFRGDDFVREVTLRDLPLDELRRILGPQPGDADPLFYDCYPVGPQQLAELGKYALEPLPQNLDEDESAFVEASRA